MSFLIRIFLLASLLLYSCTEIETTKKVEFNQLLADELKRMSEVDQIAAYIPQGKYKDLSKEEWQSFKDSVFTTNQNRLKEIFDQHGFTGYDLVGEEGAMSFWLIAQHSDHDPNFQKKVLEKMKIEVDRGNAEHSLYALLTDRVNKNTGEKQIYGTQVSYHPETGQAYIKDLKDSLTVNERRNKMGLEPLEKYLNDMTRSHFEINKEHFMEKGIMEPKLYEVQ